MMLIQVSTHDTMTNLPTLLRNAGLLIGRPVVVLVGGAAGLSTRDEKTCDYLFTTALIPVIEELGAILIDGGTDSGIIRLAGRARQRAGTQLPHIGVVAEGTVRWPYHPGLNTDAAELEPNHTHIIAVPGNNWGDEVPWIGATATALSGSAPSVTVLANGGNIAYADVRHSLTTCRPVVVLAGTGRTATHIADVRAGQSAEPPEVELARSPLLTTLPTDAKIVRAALIAALSG